jgi:predicted tellurium resistance membrane protein TerC
VEIFLQPDTWIALLTLTFMEIVLGIDNIIFVSIVASKLPVDQQKKARIGGLGLALIMRILLLLSITWIIGLTKPVLAFSDFELSWRDIILIAGGIFLLVKSTLEIHHKVEGGENEKEKKRNLLGTRFCKLLYWI